MNEADIQVLLSRINERSIIQDRGYKTPCHIWTGYKTKAGYGATSRFKVFIYIHRFVYELKKGKIPTDLELDHLCKQTDCFNSDHLEPVTHKVNMSRGYYGTKTHCPNRHEYNDKNTYVDTKGFRRCRLCKREADQNRYRTKGRFKNG